MIDSARPTLTRGILFQYEVTHLHITVRKNQQAKASAGSECIISSMIRIGLGMKKVMRCMSCCQTFVGGISRLPVFPIRYVHTCPNEGKGRYIQREEKKKNSLILVSARVKLSSAQSRRDEGDQAHSLERRRPPPNLHRHSQTLITMHTDHSYNKCERCCSECIAPTVNPATMLQVFGALTALL